MPVRLEYATIAILRMDILDKYPYDELMMEIVSHSFNFQKIFRYNKPKP